MGYYLEDLYKPDPDHPVRQALSTRHNFRVIMEKLNGIKMVVDEVVTASDISVTSLAAITATLGTVHAGTVYGTRFKVGAGTDEDIYFEDSHIRMYDGVSGNFKRIYLKYGALNFFAIGYFVTEDNPALAVGSNAGYEMVMGQRGSSHGYLWTTSSLLNITADTAFLRFYSSRQLRLPAGTAPTSNNAWGAIAFANTGASDALKFYTTGWYSVSGVSGW